MPKPFFTGSPVDAMQAYEFIFGEWLPAGGREAADAPCMEVYVSDPADTLPERQVTEIYVLLQA